MGHRLRHCRFFCHCNYILVLSYVHHETKILKSTPLFVLGRQPDGAASRSLMARSQHTALQVANKKNRDNKRKCCQACERKKTSKEKCVVRGRKFRSPQTCQWQVGGFIQPCKDYIMLVDTSDTQVIGV